MGTGRGDAGRQARAAAAKHSRRSVLIGLAGLVAVPLGYLQLADARGYWPYGGEPDGPPVSRLAADLSSPAAAVRQTAVVALAARLGPDDPDRPAAIAALVSLLSGSDHSALRADRRAAELDGAFEALGRAGVDRGSMDLRHADLRSLQADGVRFDEGITLFGADLSAAVLTDSHIAGGNMGEADFERAWFGGCTLTGWNLIGARLRHVQAPGTTFERCTFATADVTGADFATSTFVECRFDGRDLAGFTRDDVVRWDAGRPPAWPPGFTVA